MTLLEVVILLVVVGIGLWLINKFVPMDAKFKLMLNVAVTVVVVFVVLNALGFLRFLDRSANIVHPHK